jgi:signal transduction histidine kinase
VSAPLRFVGAAAALALALAAGGAAYELGRFGTSNDAATAHLQREVRQAIDQRALRIRGLAERVAAQPQLISDAVASRDALPALFAQLASLVPPRDDIQETVTVYVIDRPGTHRVLAWSEGPAGEVDADLLNGPATLAVARGTAGLRLMFIHPVEAAGRRAAVAVAETVLAPVAQAGAARFPTSYGDVTIVPAPYAGASSLTPAEGFAVSAPSGGTLLEVRFAPVDLAARRHDVRRGAIALAATPLALMALIAVGPLLDRRRSSNSVSWWLIWSLSAVAAVGACAAALVWLAGFARLPAMIPSAIIVSATALAAAIVPGGFWWRSRRRLRPARFPIKFAAEHAVAGALIATSVAATALLIERRIQPSRLAAWDSAIFPFDLQGLIEIWTLLILVLALCWATAGLLGGIAARWTMTPGRGSGLAALALWLTPLLVLLFTSGTWVPRAPAIVLLTGYAVFTMAATWLRRYYRHATQSLRLILGFAALLIPFAAVYPMTAVMVERTTRQVIENDYAPQTASQSDEIRAILLQTQDQIDRLTSLPAQVQASVGRPVESQTAFTVWTNTSLSQTRLVSDIELYGTDRALISRFTMNLPDYLYRASARIWEGTDCQWEVSGDVTRFGAIDRTMLHATRGLCDPNGQIVGAVVLHVAPTDYRALPFVSAPNPYGAVLGMTPSSSPALPGLQVVVYGWSLQPLFTSGGVAWSLDPDLFAALYKDGSPFWITRETEGRQYHVHFVQNRAGIYALGYPALTAFDHAERLAEIVAVTAVLFVIIQLGAMIYAPLAARPNAPLRVLLHEIRTSFYRKLFLFFVLVATGPLFLFTLAFGAYMDAKFRADVEAEAENIVTAARRVFEQVAAAEEPAGQRLAPLSDDLMVWIRQLIDQDVNLFEGSELIATSQRDLYNSGLLPTRTPAALYRRIALERLPTFVAEDQQYLTAASQLPARGPDAVLSVPLASRQREIEVESDALYRGVLVGSVVVVLFAAGLGAWLASRISDPVSRLTRATRLIAAGRMDVRIAADTADELRRLVDDFNSMTATLVAQRAELARANQLKAWNEMARQVAHEIKNPLTPIQLAGEHLQRVHNDQGHPLGVVFDQCVDTILGQVRLLRRIASDFANFAAEPKAKPEAIDVAPLIASVVEPYRMGLSERYELTTDVPNDLPPVWADRMMLQRALTNLVENAIQAMPTGGTLQVAAEFRDGAIVMTVADTGVGMDADALSRAFEPFFSTKTGGSGLGLANARRSIELQGGSIGITSAPGSGTTVTISLRAALLPGATEAS